MNKKRWSDPKVSLVLVALKLCEEAAEVGNEISDAAMHHSLPNLIRTQEEIEHVEFLCGVLRDRLGLL